MIDSLYRFLGRLGFTDPIHPPIVHIPVGLVIGAFVFFAIALIFKRKQLVLTARHASILALVFVFPTVLFGVLDWIHFYHGVMLPAIRNKIILAAVLLVLLTLGIILGGNKEKSRSSAIMVIYVCSFIAVVGLGYFGGSLIYAQGTSPKAAAAAPSSKALAGSATAGAPIFAANCQACHPGGANIIVATLPIKGSKRLASFAAFDAFLRAPTMPDGKPGQMPPYGTDVITAKEAPDLYAYLYQTFK